MLGDHHNLPGLFLPVPYPGHSILQRPAIPEIIFHQPSVFSFPRIIDRHHHHFNSLSRFDLGQLFRDRIQPRTPHIPHALQAWLAHDCIVQCRRFIPHRDGHGGEQMAQTVHTFFGGQEDAEKQVQDH